MFGTDAQGHPLIVERIADFNVDCLLQEFTLDKLPLYQARNMEYVQAVKVAISHKLGALIFTHVSIFDLRGLSMKYLRAREHGRQILNVAQYRYGEVAHKIFFVNTPFVFRAVWSAVSLMVHPATKAKIKVLGANYEREMADNGIAMDQLPPSLGGTFDVNACRTVPVERLPDY